MSRRRPTHRGPLRLVLTAATFLARIMMGASIAVFSVGAVIYRDPRWLLCAAIFGGLALLLSIIHTFEAYSARCAVCSASLFARTRCSKHKNAKRLLRSCRFHAATNIILFYRYRCHHCGELVLLDDSREEFAPPIGEAIASADLLTAPIPPASRPRATAIPQPLAPAPSTPGTPQPRFPQPAVLPPAAAHQAPLPPASTPPAPVTSPFELTPRG